jgi:hypothetical protein
MRRGPRVAEMVVVTAVPCKQRRSGGAWYLATSGNKTLKRVREIYALRMEIEEGFRDLKSHRYGAALRYGGQEVLRMAPGGIPGLMAALAA